MARRSSNIKSGCSTQIAHEIVGRYTMTTVYIIKIVNNTKNEYGINILSDDVDVDVDGMLSFKC